MHWDTQQVKALDNYRLQIVLADGRQGVFDMSPYLDRPAFRALREPGYFRQVGILFGAVTWPDGQDIAPATLAEQLKSVADHTVAQP
jgi:hypothetical protein